MTDETLRVDGDLVDVERTRMEPEFGKWALIERAPENEDVICFNKSWEYPLVLRKVLVESATYQHPNATNANPEWEWRDDTMDWEQDYRPTHWMRWPPL